MCEKYTNATRSNLTSVNRLKNAQKSMYLDSILTVFFVGSIKRNRKTSDEFHEMLSDFHAANYLKNNIDPRPAHVSIPYINPGSPRI